MKDMGLINQTKRGLIKANKEIILAFLPLAGPVDPVIDVEEGEQMSFR